MGEPEPAPEAMDDETLLAQINCHDPYDVEFARRFRALAAERDLAVAQNDRLMAANLKLVAAADAEFERADAAEAEVAFLQTQLDAAQEMFPAQVGILRRAMEARAARRAAGGDA